jgi:hypothetical protein
MKINEFIEGKIINGYFVLDTTEDEFAFYEALSSNDMPP